MTAAQINAQQYALYLRINRLTEQQTRAISDYCTGRTDVRPDLRDSWDSVIR